MKPGHKHDDRAHKRCSRRNRDIGMVPYNYNQGTGHTAHSGGPHEQGHTAMKSSRRENRRHAGNGVAGIHIAFTARATQRAIHGTCKRRAAAAFGCPEQLLCSYTGVLDMCWITVRSSPASTVFVQTPQASTPQYTTQTGHLLKPHSYVHAPAQHGGDAARILIVLPGFVHEQHVQAFQWCRVSWHRLAAGLFKAHCEVDVRLGWRCLFLELVGGEVRAAWGEGGGLHAAVKSCVVGTGVVGTLRATRQCIDCMQPGRSRVGTVNLCVALTAQDGGR